MVLIRVKPSLVKGPPGDLALDQTGALGENTRIEQPHPSALPRECHGRPESGRKSASTLAAVLLPRNIRHPGLRALLLGGRPLPVQRGSARHAALRVSPLG